MKTIQIPDAIYDQAADFAVLKKVPLDQVMSTALTQALDAWTGQGEIARRAARGSREKFLNVLDKAGDAEPAKGDHASGNS